MSVSFGKIFVSELFADFVLCAVFAFSFWGAHTISMVSKKIYIYIYIYIYDILS